MMTSDGKIRVYEFAKKSGHSSKEIMDLLKKEGFSVTSHMAFLNDDEVHCLNKIFAQKSAPVTNKATKTADAQLSKKIEDKKIIVPESPKNIISDTASIKAASEVKTSVATKKIEPSAAVATEKIEKETPVLIITPMTVDAFAQEAKRPASEILVQLLRWGIVSTKNQLLKEDVIIRLAQHFDIPHAKQIAPSGKTLEVTAKTVPSIEMSEERNPVVVIVGHVDHGKTTLLDFIRKTRVAAKEKGGITQHIGAYEAMTKKGKIIFIDTPGHEAFMKIRQRGIRVADIAVLVIAADDGIMPQTVEAIRQAKAMHLTIMVAINKIDKVEPNRIETLKGQLSQYDLLPEEWGGDVICVPISAKIGTGVDRLLDMISLQAEMLELKTNSSVPASGYVLESKLERGRGSVATVICQNGTLRVGDYFVCGKTAGHVTAIVDSFGKSLSNLKPSVPAQIMGFDAMPDVGDLFNVVSQNDYKQAKERQQKSHKLSTNGTTAQEGALNIILKTDTDSSREAVCDAIQVINKKLKKPFNIVHSGIGDVNESDVEFAYNTNATIITLHARTDSKAQLAVQNKKVSTHRFEIIYKLIEFLQQWSASESIETVTVRKKIGQAQVLRVFDIKNVGVIAGSVVKEGRFVNDGFVVVLRRGKKVGEGKITSLQREKKTVKEVHAGFECGFVVEGFSEWQVDDQVECHVLQTEKVPG